MSPADRSRPDSSEPVDAPRSTALVLCGQPLNEPIASHGPFVMNTREEIKQAFTDYQTGRLGT